MTVTPRRATGADRAALEALQHAAWEGNRAILGADPLPLRADYGAILATMEVWLFGDAPDGALILETPDEGPLVVWSVATAPAAGGHGLGRVMMAFAEDRARALGRDALALYTGEKLAHNVAWYARLGYETTAIETLPDRRLVHMTKTLRETTMAGRLTGKKAVLTACGAGIGLATARAFLEEGAEVIATDVDAAKIAGLKGATLKALNVLDTAAVDALAKETGPIDILFNCAGFVHHGTVLDTSEKDWDFSFDLNVKSMHRTIHAFLPGMLESGKGSIVNIASGAGSVRGIPNRYVYGATKAAVIGLTKAVAADFIKRGIRCNAICPGTIESPSLDDRIATLAKTTGQTLDAARQSFIDRQPMGRLGTAREIAMLAVYLASDEASYTTGQIHLADGGFAL